MKKSSVEADRKGSFLVVIHDFANRETVQGALRQGSWLPGYIFRG